MTYGLPIAMHAEGVLYLIHLMRQFPCRPLDDLSGGVPLMITNTTN